MDDIHGIFIGNSNCGILIQYIIQYNQYIILFGGSHFARIDQSYRSSRWGCLIWRGLPVRNPGSQAPPRPSSQQRWVAEGQLPKGPREDWAQKCGNAGELLTSLVSWLKTWQKALVLGLLLPQSWEEKWELKWYHPKRDHKTIMFWVTGWSLEINGKSPIDRWRSYIRHYRCRKWWFSVDMWNCEKMWVDSQRGFTKKSGGLPRNVMWQTQFHKPSRSHQHFLVGGLEHVLWRSVYWE